MIHLIPDDPRIACCERTGWPYAQPKPIPCDECGEEFELDELQTDGLGNIICSDCREAQQEKEGMKKNGNPI